MSWWQLSVFGQRLDPVGESFFLPIRNRAEPRLANTRTGYAQGKEGSKEKFP